MKKRKPKQNDSVTRGMIGVLVFALVFGGGLIFLVIRMSKPTLTRSSLQNRTPAYFRTTEEAKPFPVTLESKAFSRADIASAYQAAKSIPGILALQPCYCYCDRHGHRSLLDCFRTKHAADCDICVKEALLAMKLHQAGQDAEQIRAAINHGDWKQILLAK